MIILTIHRTSPVVRSQAGYTAVSDDGQTVYDVLRNTSVNMLAATLYFCITRRRREETPKEQSSLFLHFIPASWTSDPP